jgi:NAD+ synthase
MVKKLTLKGNFDRAIVIKVRKKIGCMTNIQKEMTEIIRNSERKLPDFIQNTIKNDLNKEGAVIGVSGGVDSAVVLTLAVQALGSENVYGLILPESESASSSAKFADKLCKKLNVKFEVAPITPVLESLGIYRKKISLIQEIFPEYNSSIHTTKLSLPPGLSSHGIMNIPLLSIYKDNDAIYTERLSAKQYLTLISLQNVKQRARMVIEYSYAEKMNYAVCGTTNKTEYLTGFYVKYGDGGVDLEPIADCYKFQVYTLAVSLGIDKEIIERTPSPDTWSQLASDQDLYLRMPYEILDQILYADEHNISMNILQKNIGLNNEQILWAKKHITRLKNAARYVQLSPPSCKLTS